MIKYHHYKVLTCPSLLNYGTVATSDPLPYNKLQIERSSIAIVSKNLTNSLSFLSIVLPLLNYGTEATPDPLPYNKLILER